MTSAIEKSAPADQPSAGLVARTQSIEAPRAGGVFHVQCVDKDGNVKWEESVHNLVVNEGLQEMNTKFFKGNNYTAALYLGLIEGPGAGNTYAAADTLASHAGWVEFVNYSGARKAVMFGSATLADPSVIDNSGTPSSFSISGLGGVVAGAFLATVDSGTSGILFSEANFQAPGDRTVVSGDTLNVTYTFSLDAA
jgi:hypothetical protein